MDPDENNNKKSLSKKNIRCNHASCKKKLNMFNFLCKCGKHYCITHKNPEDHECTFDYKEISNLEISNMIENKCEYIKINLI